MRTKTASYRYYKAWQNNKKSDPNTISFVRVGDFIETYDDQAVTVVNILDAVQVTRLIKKDPDVRVPMVSIPIYKADMEIMDLENAGYKVVVIREVLPDQWQPFT